MDYHNPYHRIQFYYTYLRDEWYDEDSYGISIKKIHEITGIPIKTIRKDFLEIFCWQKEISAHISHLKEDDLPSDSKANANKTKSAQEYTILDEFELWFHCKDSQDYNIIHQIESCETNFSEQLKKSLMTGDLDNIPITTNNPFYHLSVTLEEFLALQELATHQPEVSFMVSPTTVNYNDTIFPCKIKDSIFYTHQYADLNQYLNVINIAIEYKTCLSIHYKTAAGKIQSIDLRPLKISYDADENLYSLITIKENRIQVYRLDHIVSIKKCKKCLPKEDTTLLERIYPNVWGNCFSDVPIIVKVKFYDEANVWEKVRKNLQNRSNGQLYTKDGFLYYEDTVYGKNKFRSWIYGFGSSAIVLQPESLRQEIIQSLQSRISEYAGF